MTFDGNPILRLLVALYTAIDNPWVGMAIAFLLSPWIARAGYTFFSPKYTTGKFWTDEFSPEIRRRAEVP